MSQEGSMSATGAFDSRMGSEYQNHRSCSWASRARWSFWEIAVMIGGFALFWPVGLIALFWKLKKGELWPGSADSATPWASWRGFETMRWRWPEGLRSHSGNSAFETYKAQELEKLELLRRKLMDEQKAFGDFLERLKRAKDQEEFDRFMAERSTQQPAAGS
jgi:hypothetical protein